MGRTKSTRPENHSLGLNMLFCVLKKKKNPLCLSLLICKSEIIIVSLFVLQSSCEVLTKRMNVKVLLQTTGLVLAVNILHTYHLPESIKF